MVETERSEVISRLRSYSDRMTELMEACVRSPLTASEHARLKDSFASLKTDLRSDAKRCDGTRNRPEITELEENYFGPAVAEAIADIHVSVNAKPEKWVGDLYSARIDIDHMLHQLEG